MHPYRGIRIFTAIASVFLCGLGAHAATYTVSEGNSIQAALDKAKPGDTVQVLIGEYNESVTIEKEGVTLLGMAYQGDRPILVGRGEFENLERAVSVAADNVTVEGFVIRNYTRGGAVAENVADVRFTDLVVDRSGEWGILVDGCIGARVENCVLSGAAESGIAVKNSISTAVTGIEAYANAEGMRVENCSETALENNSAHNNAVGLVVLRQPGSHEDRGSYCRVTHSRFFANNRDAAAGEFPPGIGVLVISADYTEIAHCTFTGNGAYAAMVMGHATSKRGGAFGVGGKTLPNPDHTYVHHNVYRDNGNDASPGFQKAFEKLPPGDLYWDGTGKRNQWQEDRDLRTVPEKLVQRHGGAHTNVMHFI